ncbi:MAG: hypothetical protein LUG66_04415 [Clostridiales bacterium]|nr:hypothetical protein [Clostridiales bacterium]
MESERSRLIYTVCIVVSILLAVILACMIFTDKQAEKAHSENLEEFTAKAEAYEDELQALKDRLTALRNGVDYVAETAKIMTGFVVSDVSDISYIREKASAYSLSPVLVIDCLKDMDFIKEVTEAADDSWEIMLYASEFSEEINEKVLSVMAYLNSANRGHCGVFLLRDDFKNAANIQLLLDDGFIGYTGYNDSPKSGQSQDGSVYFDYSFLTASGTAIAARLSILYGNKNAMILAFDMASINSGALTENYVLSILDSIKTNEKNGVCLITSAKEVINELSEINMTEAERRAEYEAQADELQARIDELDKTIRRIYSEFEE